MKAAQLVKVQRANRLISRNLRITEASSNGEGAEETHCKMHQQQQHWPGAQRCIMGITKERFIHLNGMQCTLVSFKATTDGGRWQVKTFEADKDGNSDFIIRPQFD